MLPLSPPPPDREGCLTFFRFGWGALVCFVGIFHVVKMIEYIVGGGGKARRRQAGSHGLDTVCELWPWEVHQLLTSR